MVHTEQDRLGASRAPSDAPSPYEATAFAIVNPWGEFWSSAETFYREQIFPNEELAWKHLRAFWGPSASAESLARFSVVPVKVRVEPLTDGAPLTPQDDAAEAANGMQKEQVYPLDAGTAI